MGRKPDGKLRRGWTTGACATAAAKAAYTALLSGSFPDPVTITLPRGRTPSFALATQRLGEGWASAGVVKDAGDDPDVTHGALVVATVRPAPPGAGVVFRAGEGVGTVTLPGLPLAVGEPAINPRPRAMVTNAIAEAVDAHGGHGDAEIEISIPGGEALAQRTWNPRLGIAGGLSILGTTGVVVPYSCSAWIHAIQRGIDVARANGCRHVGACTGRTSERALQHLRGLPDLAMLDMGDFAGGMLKYLRHHPIPRLSVGGGFGKLSKLAMGHLDLHSGRSAVDRTVLARHMAHLGAARGLIEEASAASSAGQILELARSANVALADRVAELARQEVRAVLVDEIEVELLIFDRCGDLVGAAGRFDG